MNGAIVVEQVKTSIKTTTYNFIKRTFDIIVSMIGLLFLLPIALIVKLTNICTGDFKKMFYSQIRIGKNGKEFKMYKFRSMVPNADEVLKELLAKDKKAAQEWKENQKLHNDPRITVAGKILRKTSIDELPQLFNVFWGDMSMIGPRPLVKGELDGHNGIHEIYEKVRPGVTGWWAANGRSNLSYKERLDLEYYYCEHASLWLDIKCFFKTIKVVIFKTGAK